jgi:protein associated with RNAse G/E
MGFKEDFNMSELEIERNKNLNKIVTEDATGQKRNYVHIHPQNSYAHEKRKFEECWKLRQNNKQFVTEARFKDRDLRADIYVLDDDQIIEIESTSYELQERKKEYPKDTEFILLEEEN